MTITTETPTPVATEEILPGVGKLAASDLVAALDAVIPHAGTDATLPTLNTVKFETRDGELVIVATDRYTLGTYRIGWDGGDVDALLNLKDAKELLRFAKEAAKGSRTFSTTRALSLTFSDTYLEADDFGRRASYRLQEGTYVKWTAILPDLETLRANTGRIDTIGFNPAYLARFAKVGERGEPMRLTLGASPVKPARVDIGEHFTAILMPVRLSDEA